MKKIRYTVNAVLMLVFMVTINSCVSSKKLHYFTTIPESGVTDVIKIPNENVIGASDILQITIFSSDEQTNNILSNTGGSQGAAGASGGSSGGGGGYLVNDSGYIKLPLLGTLKVGGMKKEQLADTITNILIARKLVLDPIVTVRIVNFKITVLGEVNKPGVITIPNEHVNITELIGMAGDLTIYGNRQNVLLIREKDGKRYYKRFDLSKIDLFNSDMYNLQNQDIIYIEPTKAKAAALDRTPQTLSLFISSLSIFIVIYTQLIR